MKRSIKSKNITYRPDYALSSTWKLRKSDIPEVELVYTQDAVQGFISMLVGEEYKVIWAGQEALIGSSGVTDVERKTITISAAPLALKEGEAADATLVDVVAGIGVHEAGHVALSNVRGDNRYGGIVANVLEDIWIDYHTPTEKPVLGAYLNRMREYYGGDSERRIKDRLADPHPLTRDDLIFMWIHSLLSGEEAIDILDYLSWRSEPDKDMAINCLRRLLSVSAIAAVELASSTQRYNNLVLSATQALDSYEMAMPSPPPPALSAASQPSEDGASVPGAGQGSEPSDGPEDSSGAGSGSGNESDDESEGGDGSADGSPDEGKVEGQLAEGHGHIYAGSTTKANTEQSEANPDPVLHPQSCQHMFYDERMDEVLAKKVWEMREQEIEDITALVGDKGRFTMIKPQLDARIQVNDRVSDGIREAFSYREHQLSVRYPFQDAGRLSARTAPWLLSGREDIFEETITEDESDLALGLLIDCSGSISDFAGFNPVTMAYDSSHSQWNLIKQIAQSCVDAFQNSDIDLYVMGYQQGRALRLYEPGFDRLRTKDVHPDGGTPTLPGIKAIRHRMEKESGHRQEKILIHLTDGEPNDGGGRDAVRQYVSSMEKEGWTVIGVGIRVPVRAMESQYKRFFCVNDEYEVADRLAHIMEAL